MKLRITGLFRSDALTHDFTQPPSAHNPGGGLAKKAQQLKLALPFIELASEVEAIGEVVLVEPLWFSSNYLGPERDFLEVMQERADIYTNHRGYKLLWTSDFDCFRWNGAIRDQIFEATDVLCGNTPYMVNVLKAFSKDVALLTDPFYMDAIIPAPVKIPAIYSCSQVIAEKRVFTITDIYNSLGMKFKCEKGFIGSSGVWGIEEPPPHVQKLERELIDACDWHIPAAPAYEVAGHASNNWGYVCDAGMETFGYGLAEAMAGGAEVFCGQHLAYANRPVNYFSSVEEAVGLIKEKFEQSDFRPLDAPRQWLSEQCSLDVFRRQFWQIVGGAYGVE